MKVSKYGVFSGPYFPTLGLNTDQKKLRIWTLYAVRVLNTPLGLFICCSTKTHVVLFHFVMTLFRFRGWTVLSD